MNDYSEMIHLLALFFVVYGAFVGVGNWMVAIKSLFTTREVVQSGLGKALDIIWLVSMIVLIKKGYFAMVWGLI